MAKLMWMGSLYLKSFRAFGAVCCLVASAGCTTNNQTIDAETFRINSASEATQYIRSERLASKRAWQIARACDGLEFDRLASVHHGAVLDAGLRRFFRENPEEGRRIASRYGYSFETTSLVPTRQKAAGHIGYILKETSIDWTGGLRQSDLQSNVEPSSENCADGAREIDGQTLVGSFLKLSG